MGAISFIIILLLDLLAIVALFSLPPALIYFMFKRRAPSGLKEYIFIIIAGICLLVLSLKLGFYDTAGDEYIVVKKPLSTNLSNYSKALVEESQDHNMDYSPRFLLANKGLQVSETKKSFNPDLRVEVNRKMGFMPPRFILHTPIPTFGKGLSKLTYTFINDKNNEIVGEVEYSRPFYKIQGPSIAELMFQKITEFKPGLTDFSRWSEVTMSESRIRIEIPKDFCDYSDSSNKENTWFHVVLGMHHTVNSNGVSLPLITISFEMKTKDDFLNEIKNSYENNSAEFKGSKQIEWGNTFHSQFSKSENLKYSTFQYEYRKDYELEGGYLIRGHATRFKDIPNADIVEDENAIRRIIESLEVLGQHK